MIKGILVGVVLTIGLVGYGVIDTDTIELGGERLKNGVNTLAQTIDEATRND